MKEICKSLRCRHYREDVEINCYFVPPDECLLKYNLDNFGNLFGRTTMINKTIPPIPINQQVVDLETSRELNEKLKSVGIEMESYKCWKEVWLKKDKTVRTIVLSSIHSMPDSEIIQKKDLTEMGMDFIYYQTYTLTEMLSVLPYCVEFKKCGCDDCVWKKPGKHCGKRGYLEIQFDADGVRIAYNCDMEHRNIVVSMSEPTGDNLETAVAKLMIWLIDNKHVTGVNNV